MSEENIPSIRDWLQLFRSHTSPLEVIITSAGAALAAGTIFDLKVLLFALMGWMYHNFGYGMNSVEDFAGGYDRGDVNKSHHPLQRGAISVKTARLVVYSGMVFLFVYTLFISDFRPTATVLTVIVLVCGVIYNIYGKRMKGKALPIALAHSLLFILAYMATAEPDVLENPQSLDAIISLPETDRGFAAILCTLFLVIQVVYQIFISGDLKDLGLKETQAFLRLGVKIEDGMFTIPFAGTLFSLALKAINLLPLFAISYLCESPRPSVMVLLVMSGLIIYMERRLMGPRVWDHHKTTRDMAIMEVLTLFSMLFAMTGAIGWTSVMVLIVGGMVYFVLMNRYLWGTLVRPAV